MSEELKALFERLAELRFLRVQLLASIQTIQRRGSREPELGQARRALCRVETDLQIVLTSIDHFELTKLKALIAENFALDKDTLEGFGR